MAYSNRMELSYRVVYVPFDARMEITYTVVGEVANSNLVHVRVSQAVSGDNRVHVTAHIPAYKQNKAHIQAHKNAAGSNAVHVTAEQKVNKESHAHILAFTYPPYQVFAQAKAFQRLNRENKAHVRALQKTQERHNFARVVVKGRVLGETKAHIHAIQYPPWSNFVQVHVRQWGPRFNRVHVMAEVKLPLLWKRIGANDPFWRVIPPHKR